MFVKNSVFVVVFCSYKLYMSPDFSQRDGPKSLWPHLKYLVGSEGDGQEEGLKYLDFPI